MKQRYQDLVVFITGASSGIGEALAKEFYNQGAKVMLTARRSEQLRQACSNISNDSKRIRWEFCDVTDDASVELAFKKCHEQFGSVDVVVANAGFGVAGKVEKLTVADFQRQFDTNVFGVIRTLKASHQYLTKNSGRAVLIGSVAGYAASQGSSAYSMSKSAVKMLADCYRLEVLDSKVSVTLIAPGFVESNIRRVDNFGKFNSSSKEVVPAWLLFPVEKAAKQIVRSVFRRKREVVITGHGKILVWIFRHFPAILYYVIALSKLNFRKLKKRVKDPSAAN